MDTTKESTPKGLVFPVVISVMHWIALELGRVDIWMEVSLLALAMMAMSREGHLDAVWMLSFMCFMCLECNLFVWNTIWRVFAYSKRVFAYLSICSESTMYSLFSIGNRWQQLLGSWLEEHVWRCQLICYWCRPCGWQESRVIKTRIEARNGIHATNCGCNFGGTNSCLWSQDGCLQHSRKSPTWFAVTMHVNQSQWMNLDGTRTGYINSDENPADSATKIIIVRDNSWATKIICRWQ